MILAQKQAKAFGRDVRALFAFAAQEGCAAVQIHLPEDGDLPGIRSAMKDFGLGIASVNAMSCHMLGPDRERQAHEHRQVERALAVADDLGAPMITNFAGHDPGKDLAGNAEEFARVYAPHARIAERLGLRICFENCPMIGGSPRIARNIAWCPTHWQALFTACDSPALGLELDVSHTVWTGLDAASLIRTWKDRIHHVQIKDCRLDRTAQAEAGLLGGIPHGYVPLGEGDLDAQAVFAALIDSGYGGFLTGDIEGDDLEAIRRNLAAMRGYLARVA